MTLKLPNIRQFFTHERAVLMACIGIALCFWVLNRLSKYSKKTVPVRIEYLLPQGKAFSELPPQYVQVTRQGTGWDFLTDREQRLFIQIGADSVQHLSFRDLAIQQLGSDVIGVNPDQVNAWIEPTKKKWVRVEAIAQINFVKGFDLADSIEVTPSVIEIEGPKSLVEDLAFIQTDTLRFDRFKDSVLTKIKLHEPPLFKLSTTEIVAKIVAEQFTEKSLFVPIVIKNAPQSLRIFPNKIKLDCTVALSHYPLLDADKFIAEVDLKNIDFKTKNNTIAISLNIYPIWVRNIKFSPKSVEFYFEK
ncbi:MAG: hypothetical protein JNL70_09530 [Saprospiraceae bacterium]|nr:hypothetical protein [Saprospiraceae bacterium]